MFFKRITVKLLKKIFKNKLKTENITITFSTEEVKTGNSL